MTKATTVTNRLSEEMQALLTEHEHDLIFLSERLGHVMSIHAELVRVARLKPFVIRSLPMWRTILGERDMLVTDAASWAKAFYSTGGFLGKLQASGLKALARACKHDPDDEDFQKRRNEEWRADAFARLFPGAIASGAAKPEDVEALKTSLRSEFEPLLLDRHEHRAHKYEQRGGAASMLTPTEVAGYVERFRVLLADVRCLSSNSSFTAHGLPPEANPDDKHAQDVVDLVLLGPIGWIIQGEPNEGHPPELRYWWQRRTAHYERLHAAHEARGSGDDDPFNAPGKLTEKEGD